MIALVPSLEMVKRKSGDTRRTIWLLSSDQSRLLWRSRVQSFSLSTTRSRVKLYPRDLSEFVGFNRNM